MSTRDSQLDERLQALFRGLDTAPDFDARLMARLRAESQTDAAERASRARQQERERHGRALLDLQSWRRSMLRLLALDTLGIAFLLVVAVVTAWPHLNPQAMDSLRQYGPHIATLLCVLLAAVPLVGAWAEWYRSPIRLL
jgi:cation transport ATPase